MRPEVSSGESADAMWCQRHPGTATSCRAELLERAPCLISQWTPTDLREMQIGVQQLIVGVDKRMRKQF